MAKAEKKVQKQFCKAKNGNSDAENYNKWCKMRKHDVYICWLRSKSFPHFFDVFRTTKPKFRATTPILMGIWAARNFPGCKPKAKVLKGHT